jgi:hypothetical protein
MDTTNQLRDLLARIRGWQFTNEAYVEITNADDKLHCLTGPAAWIPDAEYSTCLFAIDGCILSLDIWLERAPLTQKEKTIFKLKYG